MTAFIVAALKPFILVLMLLVAWPFKKLVERMPDSKLKRFFLFKW